MKLFLKFYSLVIIWMKTVKFMRKWRSSTHEDDEKLFRSFGGNPNEKRDF